MQIIEGIDFYYEEGFMVLTKEFLLKRGKCCTGGCKNCPYGFHDNKEKDGEADNIQLH